jgi:nucleoside-diphosphate-sugar epimerase
MIRWATAAATVRLAERGIRSVVLGLPTTVHGEGDHGFIHTVGVVAREKGVSGYIDDGTHTWPAVHRLDAARLLRLAVDKAPAGTVLHAVAEPDIPTREIAEAIAHKLDVPTASIPSDAAAAHFGWVAPFWGMSLTGDSGPARELLGWEAHAPHPAGEHRQVLRLQELNDHSERDASYPAAAGCPYSLPPQRV